MSSSSAFSSSSSSSPFLSFERLTWELFSAFQILLSELIDIWSFYTKGRVPGAR